MNPAMWLVWALSAGAVAISTTNPFYLLPLASVCALIHAAHGRDGAHVRPFRFFLMLAAVSIALRTGFVFFDPGGPTRENVTFALTEGSRLGILLIVFGTFNSVSDPFGLLKLAPRRFYEPAVAAALALSLTPRTMDALTRVKEAQWLRGADIKRWRMWPALAVPVLETGMEEAVTLAESMDARGHGRGPRTRYRPDGWSRGAAAVAIASVAVAITFAGIGPGLGGDLIVSTTPLLWPNAHPALVGCVLSLGLPALLSRETY